MRPIKWNLENLDTFANIKFSTVKSPISALMEKLDMFEDELKTSKKPLWDVHHMLSLLCNVSNNV